MFKKYMHVERLGNEEVEGILDGEVNIFPKIDGTNASVWYEDGVVKCGSRNRELSLENDNAGFCAFVMGDERFNRIFTFNPSVRLYGEWLVKHSLKTYRDDAWREFYIFDVCHEQGCTGESFIPYIMYSKMLENYGFKAIPPLANIKNATEEKVRKFLEVNTYLIKENEGIGEGIVIKNYDFKNKYGRTIWAKIVTNEFKDKHRKEMGSPRIEMKESIENEIVEEFITETLIEKEYQKIKLEGWNSKCIPRLLNTVFYCLIEEEIWNILKKKRQPTINFRKLQSLTTRKIKELRGDLF